MKLIVCGYKRIFIFLLVWLCGLSQFHRSLATAHSRSSFRGSLDSKGYNSLNGNRFLDNNTVLLNLNFVNSNCEAQSKLKNSTNIFGTFENICSPAIKASKTSIPSLLNSSSCCLASNGVWNQVTSVISIGVDSNVSSSDTDRLIPPQILSVNSTENNVIFSLGGCYFCGYNMQISLLSDSDITSKNSGSGSFAQLMVRLCQIDPESKDINQRRFLSDRFFIPSTFSNDRKAILASIAVNNVEVFFPPYLRLYQLQVKFHVAFLETSFMKDVSILNSTSYYYSTQSVIDIKTWGSNIVNVSIPLSGSTHAKNSFAQVFPVTPNSQLSYSPSQSYDRYSAFNANLCNTLIPLRTNMDGNFIVSPFQAVCGIILYSVKLVNFVDVTRNEWEYLLFNDFPQSSVVALDDREIVPENGLEDASAKYFENPMTFECLPSISDLPSISLNLLTWVPTLWESFLIADEGQSGQLSIGIISPPRATQVQAACFNNFSCSLQDKVYFHGDNCSGTNSNSSRNSKSEWYLTNGTLLLLSNKSLEIWKHPISVWNSSIVSVPLFYRPTFGRVSTSKTNDLETLEFSVRLSGSSSLLPINTFSTGSISVVVKEILKPLRIFPSIQQTEVISRALTIIKIDYVREFAQAVTSLEFVELPQKSKVYCLPLSILARISANSSAYTVYNKNIQFLRNLLVSNDPLSASLNSCLIGSGGGNFSRNRSLDYKMHSTYFAIIYDGKEEYNTTFEGHRQVNKSIAGWDRVSIVLHGSDGSKSIPGELRILVSPSIGINTGNFQSHFLKTDWLGGANVSIIGQDFTTTGSLSIFFEIVSYPLFGKLNLSTYNRTSQLKPSVSVSYAFNASSHRFSFPSESSLHLPISTNCAFMSFDEFSVRAVAVERVSNSSVYLYSSPVKIKVALRNVNDATIVKIHEYQTAQLRGSSGIEKSVDRIDKTISAFSATNGEVLVVNTTLLSFAYDKWSVEDPDCGIAPVRVRINTTRNSCRLSLSDSALSLVNFNSQTYCRGSQIKMFCRGDGRDDTDMVFVVSSTDLLTVLRGLSYYSYSPNSKDTVTITVFDGEGSDCFPSSALDIDSVYDGCLMSKFHIDITIGAWRNLDQRSKNGFFGDESWTLKSVLQSSTRLQYVAAAIGAILVALICFIRICQRRRLGHRSTTRKMNVTTASDEKKLTSSRTHRSKLTKKSSMLLTNNDQQNHLLNSPSPTRRAVDEEYWLSPPTDPSNFVDNVSKPPKKMRGKRNRKDTKSPHDRSHTVSSNGVKKSSNSQSVQYL